MRRISGAVPHTLLASLIVGVAMSKCASLHVPSQFPDIQTALDSAAAAGDTIVLALSGSPYRGANNVNLDFLGKAAVLQSSDPLDEEVRDNTVIDGQLADRIVMFNRGEGRNTKIRGITLERGTAATGGAILVYSESSPVIEGCLLQGNVAQQGGAVAIAGRSNAIFVGCIFRNNRATLATPSGKGEGGAIWCTDSSSGVFARCLFSANRADRHGGGISTTDSADLTILGSRLRGNTSLLGGGALFSSQADSIYIMDSRIESNGSGGSGGGALITQARNTEIADSIFSYNSSVGPGGGLAINQGPGLVRHTHFSKNHSVASGGSLYFDGVSGTIFRCSIGMSSTSDSLESVGGGAHLVGGKPAMVACTIHGNTSRNGAGVAISGGARARVDNCILDNNTLTSKGQGAGSGGALYISQASTLVEHCTIAHNSASLSGGAIYAEGFSSDTLWVHNGILTSNSPDEIKSSGQLLVDVTYCDIDGVPFPGVGNIDATPIFIDERNQYKYVPDVSSYSIDAGDGEPDGVDWCALPVDWWCGSVPDSMNTSLPDMGAYGGTQGPEWGPNKSRSGRPAALVEEAPEAGWWHPHVDLAISPVVVALPRERGSTAPGHSATQTP